MDHLDVWWESLPNHSTYCHCLLRIVLVQLCPYNHVTYLTLEGPFSLVSSMEEIKLLYKPFLLKCIVALYI